MPTCSTPRSAAVSAATITLCYWPPVCWYANNVCHIISTSVMCIVLPVLLILESTDIIPGTCTSTILDTWYTLYLYQGAGWVHKHQYRRASNIPASPFEKSIQVQRWLLLTGVCWYRLLGALCWKQVYVRLNHQTRHTVNSEYYCDSAIPVTVLAHCTLHIANHIAATNYKLFLK